MQITQNYARPSATQLRDGNLAFEMTAEAPSQARVAVHDFRSLAPDELEVSRQRRRDTQAIVTRILEQGIERGEIRPIDPKLVTMAVFSITNWAVEWFDPNGATTVEEAAGFFADLLVDGVGASPTSRSTHGDDD